MKRILITGATSGLGLAIAGACIERGWDVFGTGRTPPSNLTLQKSFSFIYTDFGKLQNTADTIHTVIHENNFDLVINNAGVLSPPSYSATNDGYEYSVQVNFLAHLLINEIIINYSEPANLPVFVSITSPVYRRGDFTRASALISGKQEMSYRAINAYSDSKLLLVNLMSHYSRIYSSGCFVSFNPGVFSSGIYRMQKDYFRLLYSIAAPIMRSPSSVAQSLVAICSRTDLKSGLIYDRNGRKSVPPEPSKEFEKMITDLCNSINFGTGN